MVLKLSMGILYWKIAMSLWDGGYTLSIGLKKNLILDYAI